MRWPFSIFSRGGAADDASASPGGPAGAGLPGGTGAAGGAGPAGPVAAAAPAATAAWRTLPVVQRALGAPSLIAPAIPFGRALATQRRPDPILRPLGHDVAADGPGGLVSGIAVPLVVPAPAVPVSGGTPTPAPRATGPAGRALQRRAIGSRASVADLRARGEDDRLAEVPLADAGEPGVVKDLALPPRPLPVVAPSPRPPVATRVADASAPAPARVVARLADARGWDATSMPVPDVDVDEAAEEAAVGGRADASGTGAPAAAAPVQRTALDASAPPAVDAPDGSLAGPARRTLGESRRLGLGAPLAAKPIPSPAHAEGSALPLARLARPGAATGPGGALPEPAALQLPPITPAVAAAAPMPVLQPLQRETAAAPAPAARALPAAPEAEGSAAGAPSSAAGRPLVGDPGRAIAGFPPAGDEDDEPDAGGSSGVAGSDLPALPLQRLPSATGLTGGPGFEARTAIPGSGAADSAAPATEAPVPMADGPSSSPEAAAALGSAAGAGEAAAAGGAPAERADLPLAPAVTGLATSRRLAASQAAAPTTLGLLPSGAAQPVVARLAVGRPSSGPGAGNAPVVQRSSPSALPGASSASLPSSSLGSVGAVRPGAPSGAMPWPGSVSAGGAGATVPAGSSGMGLARAVAPVVRGRPAGGGSDMPVVARLAGSQVGSRAEAVEARQSDAAVPGGEATGIGAAEAGIGGPGGQVEWRPSSGFTRAAGGPVVQRAEAAGGGAEVEAGGAGGTIGAAAAGGGAEGGDVEKMADQVYDRIRERIASELLLDRERAGLLVDG